MNTTVFIALKAAISLLTVTAGFFYFAPVRKPVEARSVAEEDEDVAAAGAVAGLADRNASLVASVSENREARPVASFVDRNAIVATFPKLSLAV